MKKYFYLNKDIRSAKNLLNLIMFKSKSRFFILPKYRVGIDKITIPNKFYHSKNKFKIVYPQKNDRNKKR